MTAALAIPAPRLVIFDWDGTLVDSWGAIAQALNHALAVTGRPVRTEAEVRDRLSRRDGFRELFGEDWQAAAALFYQAFEAHHLEALRPLAGALRLLDAVRDHGLPAVVVSNKTGRYLRREVEHLGWQDRFRAVVGAGDAGCDKPSPEPVALALRKAGIPPGERALFIGDTAVDLECAHAAGCVPVLIGSVAEDAAGRFPPAAVFGDCAEAAAALAPSLAASARSRAREPLAPGLRS